MKLAGTIASIAAVMVLGGVAEPVEASQLGLYASGYYGDADREGQQGPYDALAASVRAVDYSFTAQETGTSFDTKGSSYGFAVGYRLMPHLALEGGYMDLGGIAYRSRSLGSFDDDPGNVLALQQNIDMDVSGIAVSALGVLPLGYRWEVYARGGLMFSSSQFDYFATIGSGADDRVSDSQSSIDLLAGAGLSFSFAEIYGLRAEFVRVFDAGEEHFGLPAGDVDLITIGITVAF